MNMIPSSSAGRIMELNGLDLPMPCRQSALLDLHSYGHKNDNERKKRSLPQPSSPQHLLSPRSDAVTRDRPGRPASYPLTAVPRQMENLSFPSPHCSTPSRLQPISHSGDISTLSHVKALYASLGCQTGSETEGGRRDELPELREEGYQSIFRWNVPF